MAFGAQMIAVSDKQITLRGGHADCSAPNATGRSTLDGAGGAAASVLAVTGSGNDVILENLIITGGDQLPALSGGGIGFGGDGVLTLRNSEVSDNFAGSGGGIHFFGRGELRLEADSLVLRNVAQGSGGGVWLGGDTLMLMHAAGSAIQSNVALQGDGGGLAVHAPAHASIGSAGTGSGGAVFDNEAFYGGGISASGIGIDGTAYVSLFAAEPGTRLRIHGNRAHRQGGGLFLRPLADFGTSAVNLVASNIDVEDNEAPDGSALYITGGWIAAANLTGSTINGNRNVFIDGQPAQGATVLVDQGTIFSAERIELSGNTGTQVLQMLGNGAFAHLKSCLITNNVVDQNLATQGGGGSVNRLILDQCTVAGNQVVLPYVFVSEQDFQLTRSIIDQPGKSTLLFSGDALTVNNVIASETATIRGGSVLALAPRFMDPEGGDYRPQAASPAVDFSESAEGVDLSGNPRGRDIGPIPDRFGPGDLGAYERVGIGNLVRNRSFTGDLRLWDEVRPGVSSWNGAGADGSGSVDISYTRSDLSQPAAGLLVGLSQCVHIPGPGNYRLSGQAYGDGPSSFERDRVSLRWVFRADTAGEGCDGADTVEGVVHFPSSPAFSPPTLDGIIEVPASQWTRNSVVVMSLAVEEGGLNLLTTTSGHFDALTFEPVEPLPPEVFSSGFESS